VPVSHQPAAFSIRPYDEDMSSTERYSRSERAALCNLMTELGPDAPTLCEGWTTRDLADHLVIRESRPDAGIGLVVPAFSSWTRKVQDQAATKSWPDLVSEVRHGPPKWSPAAIPAIDDAMNTIEYFVHHEDVRRAQPAWGVRQLDPSFTADLWSRIPTFGKLLTRSSPVGIVVAPTDGPAAGTDVRLCDGKSSVRLSGPVGELVLALFGRITRGVDMMGSDDDIAAFIAYPR
jgi:uncharacterized protein (TIGR03085 family)